MLNTCLPFLAQIEEVIVAELQRGLVQHAGVTTALAKAITGNEQVPVTVLHTEWI